MMEGFHRALFLGLALYGVLCMDDLFQPSQQRYYVNTIIIPVPQIKKRLEV